MLWAAVDVFGQHILKFVTGVILARLLLPEEFGLLGVLSIFLSFSLVFINSGFSFALIRLKNVTDDYYYTVFWFNLLVSFLFFLILWFSASYVSAFYNQPVLSPILKIISLNLIIHAVGLIQHVKFTRELKFKQLAAIGLVSKAFSGGLAIYLAFNGFGVWSLVIQQLMLNLIQTTLMIYKNRFIPKLRFSVACFKDLFAFSSKLLYSRISGRIVSNIYPAIIGKYFAISDVGFFNRAQGLQSIPVLTFMGIIQKVTLPVFAKMQDDDFALKTNYRKAIKMTLFLIGLPLLLLFVTSHSLILVLYTEKWLPAAPYLQILVVGGFFYPINALNYNMIGIKGRSDILMKLSFSHQLLTLCSIVIGMFWGITGLVAGYAVSHIFAWVLIVYFSNKVINYPYLEQLNDMKVIFMNIFITAIVGYLIISFIPGDLLKVIVVFTSCSILYIFLAWSFRMDALFESVDVIKGFLIKRKT